MRGADSRALSGPGLLFLRHDKFIEAGGSVDGRSCLLAVTVDGERSEYGDNHIAAAPGGNAGKHSVADINGAFHWSRDSSKRPMGSFVFAAPAVIVDQSEKGDKFGVAKGKVFARPIRKGWDDPDTRFAILQAELPKNANEPPAGSLAVALAGMEENEQRVVLFSPQTQAALIAPWRGGKKENGTIVFDLNDKGELDPLKNGRIQHLLRVTHAEGEWQPALNMSATGKNSPGGHGLCWWSAGDSDKSVVAGAAAKGIAAWLSVERGGPLHPGHPTKDRHRAGTNTEGEPTQPVHVQIDALFYQDEIRDGAKEHGPDYPEIEPTDWQHTTHVYEGFDKKRGRWRRWTTVPLSRPVPFVPKRPEDEPPIPVPQFQIPNPVPRPIPWGGLGIGEPTNPSTGSGSPSIFGFELALPSLAFTATRHRDSQAGQGLYGEPGGDVAPFDPSEGGGIPIPPLGTGGTGADRTVVGDPFAGETDIGTTNETRGRTARRKAFDATQNGRAYNLSKEAIDRGGPAPLSGHIFSLAKVSNGKWAYKSRPGEGHGQGTAEASGLILAPGGILGDGPDDQSAWAGDLAVLAYGGQFGGDPAGLGIGSYDQVDGDWYDGAVFSLSGAAGSRNLRLDFRDASGAARTGTTSHYGHWSPGTDSAHSLGTAVVRWLTLHADNVGALSAPADAVYGTEIYVGGHRVPRTLSSQYADATNSGTGEDDLLSYTVPASTLSANGDSIVFEAPFSLDGTPDTLTIKFKFGATSITIFGASVDEETVVARIRVVRVTETTQRIYVVVNDSLLTTTPNDQAIYTTASEDLSGAVVTKFTGEAATSGDTVTQRAMYVRLDPA